MVRFDTGWEMSHPSMPHFIASGIATRSMTPAENGSVGKRNNALEAITHAVTFFGLFQRSTKIMPPYKAAQRIAATRDRASELMIPPFASLRENSSSSIPIITIALARQNTG